MGDRCLMQCHTSNGEFGPVIYTHWGGSAVPSLVKKFLSQARRADLDVCSADLTKTCDAFSIWNASKLLTAEDTHGDAGVVLINVTDGTVRAFGGYLERHAWEKLQPFERK